MAMDGAGVVEVICDTPHEGPSHHSDEWDRSLWRARAAFSELMTRGASQTEHSAYLPLQVEGLDSVCDAGMSGADLRLDGPGALMGRRFDGIGFAHACHQCSVAVDNNAAILRRQVAQAEKALAIGDRPAAQALALELKQCVQAIPRTSPAQSFSSPRAQADVEASGS